MKYALLTNGFKWLPVLIFGFMLCSCRTVPKEPWHAVTQEGVIENVVWTEEEILKDPATRTIKITEDSSFHVIHLRGSEKPHTHDRHDLYAFMISGESKINLAGKEALLRKGDSVFIPRGTVHWAENIHPDGSEAYIVFVPALTEPDYRELGKRTL